MPDTWPPSVDRYRKAHRHHQDNTSDITPAAAKLFGAWSWDTQRENKAPASPPLSPRTTQATAMNTTASLQPLSPHCSLPPPETAQSIFHIPAVLQRMLSHDHSLRNFGHKRNLIDHEHTSSSPLSPAPLSWRPSRPNSLLSASPSPPKNKPGAPTQPTSSCVADGTDALLQNALQTLVLNASTPSDQIAALEASALTAHALHLSHASNRGLLAEAMHSRDHGLTEKRRALCLQITDNQSQHQAPNVDIVRSQICAWNILATQTTEPGQVERYLDRAMELAKGFVGDRQERAEMLRVVAMLREHAHEREQRDWEDGIEKNEGGEQRRG